ncbi:MAG: flagellar biosynthesis regulator FlaF [Deltaproteobacteria bacterium]
MSAPNMAQTTYNANVREIRTDRANEYEALSRVTARMKRAETVANTPFADLAAAMHDNRRLWTALAQDVASDQNGLPKELRAKLFYLYQFVSVHTGRILAGQAKVGPLIDINIAVMRGLMPQRAAA